MRRRALLISGGLVVATRGIAAAGIELQSGDPDLDAEQLRFDDTALVAMAKASRAVFASRLNDFPERLLEEATGWVGKSRGTHEDEITKLLNLFDLPFQTAEKQLIPFCAAGIGYVAASVYAKAESKPSDLGVLSNYLFEVQKYHFFPSPRVATMRFMANDRSRWVPAAKFASVRPGSLVVFDWNGKGQTHIGLLQSVNGTSLQTIEFNTAPEGAIGSQRQGGAVAIRNRDPKLKAIQGYIRVT